MDSVFTDEQVFQALCRELGEGQPTRELADSVTALLRSYDPSRMPLSLLTTIVSERMYAMARRVLGKDMTAILPDGRTRRILPQDMPEAADRVVLVMLEGLSVTPDHFALLKDHMLATGSVGAMTVLYRRYTRYHSSEELALMARILREHFPRGGEPGWLKQSG